MRDLKNNLTSGKNTSNIQSRKGKSFGYQVLGFGAGGGGPAFIVATGGTITTVDTDYKVHTFTGPGTFTVCAAGNSGGSESVDYLVVAGGGAGQTNPSYGNGGGAGGFRTSPGTASGSYSVSPLGASPAAAIIVTATGYPITVGAGSSADSPGNDSIALGLTSEGGGAAASCTAGGSGSGGGGTGNSPPVNPPQGQNGGPGNHAGGGGAGAAGLVSPGPLGGFGGNGSYTNINPATGVADGPVTSARYYSGGGGGGYPGGAPITPSGGAGGGGVGGEGGVPGSAGTANTGGGGGGSGNSSPGGFTGGSGIVIIRYKFQ